MRIGFDAKRYFHNRTGLGNYSRDTVRILNEAFTGLTLLLFNPKKRNDNYPNTVDGLNKIQEINPGSNIYKRLSSFWRIGPITKEIKANNLDVFHGLSNELPLGINKTNVKSVVTIHDLIFKRFPGWYNWIDRLIYNYKFKYACQTADKIIAISEQTKADIINYFGIDDAKIQVIYQGCHPAFQQRFDLNHLHKIRGRYDLPSNFILNVGTIEKRKNLLSLVKAIQPISSANLVIVGKKKAYADEVFDYVSAHGMEQRVFYINQITMEDLVAVYQCADLFVYPSIFEGFGIPIIEALFSGVPVITSTGSCFSEAGGPASLYIDPFDVEALQQAIELVYLNPEITNEMANKGKEFVQKFKDENIASQLFETYRKLIRE